MTSGTRSQIVAVTDYLKVAVTVDHSHRLVVTKIVCANLVGDMALCR